MPQSTADVDLYNLLITASQRALVTAHYEAAYLSLEAALHCAQDMGDAKRLEDVAQEAQQQLDRINATAKGSVMSSFAAAQRPSGVDLYHVLAKTAAARAKLFRHPRHPD